MSDKGTMLQCSTCGAILMPVGAAEIEVARRKHHKSIFGTVPISDHQLAVMAAADAIERHERELPKGTKC